MYQNYHMGYTFAKAIDAGEFVEFVHDNISFDLTHKIEATKNPNKKGFTVVFGSNTYNSKYINKLFNLFCYRKGRSMA